MFDFNWTDAPVFVLDEKLISDWLVSVCQAEDKTVGDVSVVFMSDEALLKVNQEFLRHDYYTDIITFDYCDDKLVSGDLFVSVDRVKDNSASLDVGFDEELNRVLVHGLLHLCGYGDKLTGEEKQMREKEDFYLNKLRGFT